MTALPRTGPAVAAPTPCVADVSAADDVRAVA